MIETCAGTFWKGLRDEDIPGLHVILDIVRGRNLDLVVRGSSAMPIEKRRYAYRKGYSDIDLVIRGNRDNDFFSVLRGIRRIENVYMAQVEWDKGGPYVCCDSQGRSSFIVNFITPIDLHFSYDDNPAFPISRETEIEPVFYQASLLENKADRRHLKNCRENLCSLRTKPVQLPEDIARFHTLNAPNPLAEAYCNFIFRKNKSFMSKEENWD